MGIEFSGRATREELEASTALRNAGYGLNTGPETNTEVLAKLGNRDEKGQFGTGHSASVGNKGGRGITGIIGLIKARTGNYADLVDNLIKASEGKEVHGRKPNYRDIIDATNNLLDRSLGKPTQQVLHTGDDVAKELLAARMEALRLQRKQVEGDAVTGNDDTGTLTAKVTSIGAMREGTKG